MKFPTICISGLVVAVASGADKATVGASKFQAKQQLRRNLLRERRERQAHSLLRKRDYLKDFRVKKDVAPTDPPTVSPTVSPTASPVSPTISPMPSAFPSQAPSLEPLSVERPPVDVDVTESCENGERVFQVDLTIDGAGGINGTRTVPIEIVFALDSSGSMSSNDPQQLRQSATIDLINRLNPFDDLASVVSWDDGIDFATPLINDFELLRTQVNSVDSSGGTDLNIGLNRAISSFTPKASAQAIVFLTDGGGTYTSCSVGGPASVAANNGYTIYSIGLGSADTAPLIDMAICTGGIFSPSPSALSLETIFDDIFQEVLFSTVPFDIAATITLQSGFELVTGSDNPPADSITTNEGQTILFWKDVDDGLGLPAGESVGISFNVKATTSGELTDRLSSGITFSTPEGDMGRVGIPVLTIDIDGTSDPCDP
eukprot:scaffold1619_cov161-Amphora_coffeaeformis.AAC.10